MDLPKGVTVAGLAKVHQVHAGLLHVGILDVVGSTFTIDERNNNRRIISIGDGGVLSQESTSAPTMEGDTHEGFVGGILLTECDQWLKANQRGSITKNSRSELRRNDRSKFITKTAADQIANAAKKTTKQRINNTTKLW